MPFRTKLQVANPLALVNARPPPVGPAQLAFGKFKLEPVLTLTPTLGIAGPLAKKT
jgi:hypothetical protein